MFLLDTHTFLWYIFDDPRLPQNVKDIISDADDVYVSMATLWEIAIKQSIKKLQYPSKWLSQNAKHLVFSFTVLRYFRGS